MSGRMSSTFRCRPRRRPTPTLGVEAVSDKTAARAARLEIEALQALLAALPPDQAGDVEGRGHCPHQATQHSTRCRSNGCRGTAMTSPAVVSTDDGCYRWVHRRCTGRRALRVRLPGMGTRDAKVRTTDHASPSAQPGALVGREGGLGAYPSRTRRTESRTTRRRR